MATKTSVLKAISESIKIVTNKVVPSEYFDTRKGLYIWSDFKERILPKAKTTEQGAEFELASFDLTEYANDKQIESSLPKKHLFTETEVCAVIASLIDKHPKGNGEDLQNNGYVNLFYTKAFVVYVYWLDGAWRVDAWFRYDHVWHADYRVFSPAN